MVTSMKFLLLFMAAMVLAGSALAAGCPPGTKQHCVQGKGRVVCSCR
jgi:hypothetical protein